MPEREKIEKEKKNKNNNKNNKKDNNKNNKNNNLNNNNLNNINNNINNNKNNNINNNKEIEKEINERPFMYLIPKFCYLTGLKSDFCQFAILLPTFIHHIRLFSSLSLLERSFSLSFNDKSLLKIVCFILIIIIYLFYLFFLFIFCYLFNDFC